MAFDFDEDGVVDSFLGYPPSANEFRCGTDANDISCFGLYRATTDDEELQFGEKLDVTCVDENPFPSSTKPDLVWSIEQFNAARTLAAPASTPLTDLPDDFDFGVAPVTTSGSSGAIVKPSTILQGKLSVVVQFTTTQPPEPTTVSVSLGSETSGASTSTGSGGSNDGSNNSASATGTGDASSTTGASDDDLLSAQSPLRVSGTLASLLVLIASLSF